MTETQWLSSLHPDDSVTWSQAAIDLALIERTGVPVLPAFAIAPSIHHTFFAQVRLKKQITQACSDLAPRFPQAFAGAAKEVREAVMKAEFPAATSKQLAAYTKELHQHLVHTKKEVPVRLVLMDGSHHSVHGMVSTGISLEELLKRLWSISFSDRALYRRYVEGSPVIGHSAPVLVQYYPEPDLSGTVRFGDESGLDDTVITIRVSPGEHVPNLSTADTYRFDRHSMALLSREHGKHWWTSSAHGAKTVHTAFAHQPTSLSDDLLLRLAKLGKTAVQGFADAPVVNWIYADGTFWVSMSHSASPSTGSPLPAGVVVHGIPGSLGVAVGRVRFVRTANDQFAVQDGDIVVTEHLHTADREWLAGVRAVVTRYGTPHTVEGQLPQALGIPAVVGARAVGEQLKDGQLVTVDGEQGIVLSGSVIREGETSSMPLITGTALYANLASPFSPLPAAHLYDGVGVVSGDSILEMLGVTLEEVVAVGRGREYAAVLQESLATLLSAATSVPVRYRLHDSDTHHVSHLRGARRAEPNPALGYRGAHRLIQQPELLDLEVGVLEALERAGHENLQVIIPMARSVEEITAVSAQLSQLKAKVWVACETPATAILAEAICEAGIHGVLIDIPRLSRLLTGLDHGNARVGHVANHANDALLETVEFVVKTCRTKKVTCVISSDIEILPPEVVETAVRAGVSGVSVHPDQLSEVRRLVASIEQRVILEHATE